MFSKAWLLDSIERVVRAFLVAFVGQLVLAAGNVFNQSTLHAAEAAGIASCLSVLLSVLGGVAAPDTPSPASLLPAPKPARRRRHPADRGGALIVVLVVIAFLFVAGLFASRF